MKVTFRCPDCGRDWLVKECDVSPACGDWSLPLKQLMPTEFRLWLAKLQTKIDDAIGKRFGLCDGWQHKIPVAQADNLALAREGRDLMVG